MRLIDSVRVARAFQRAIRIDTDASDVSALDGFVCPPSSASALRVMARHIAETGQGAFTWTGPYGAGKSSLAITLIGALDGNQEISRRAAASLGVDTTAALWEALPPKSKGWRTLPVVGNRVRPAQAIGEALVRSKLKRVPINAVWSDEDALGALEYIAQRDAKTRGGLLVVIDEMGKFLEGAAYDGTDIYFFQQLAELASRSGGRLVVVGALHQAFEEYSNRLSREMRDEWAKIQGRFIDLPIDASSEEQLALLGKAIEFGSPYRDITRLAQEVSELTGGRAGAEMLTECWPLHPIVACLLGPITRRRFGQNQRSLFGFLSSAEPLGFQDFLKTADRRELYSPARLWDYLRANMEPSIMASSDGHRWSLASNAIERCRAKGGQDLHIQILQTLALLDLFKERSGVAASQPALRLALQDRFNEDAIKTALRELQEWSMVIHREYSESYGIYEGSDFDIDAALDWAYRNIAPASHNIRQLNELKPIFAKRHYHEFGALRWYDSIVCSISDLDEVVADCLNSNRLSDGSAGAFILAISEGNGAYAVSVKEMACKALERCKGEGVDIDIAVGMPERADRILASLAQEAQALKWTLENAPELRGDGVARAEVHSRIASAEERIDVELEGALDSSVWHFSSGGKEQRLGLRGLSAAASNLADKRFAKSPKIFNELLNRITPSSSAAAGRKLLLRRMIANEGQHRLGIEGYPVEGGLFESLLNRTGLYRETESVRSFCPPDNSDGHIRHIWRATEELIKDNADRAVAMQEIYDLWRQPPYGVKDGVMPILAAAFLLSNKRGIAFYREGVFLPALSEIHAEMLSRTPRDISARWMGEYRVEQAKFWHGMIEITREITSADLDETSEPLEVARALVAAYDRLPKWTERTRLVSDNAKRVRRMLKDAHDPNKVIFDDIVDLAERNEDAPALVKKGMQDLRSAYPDMLERLRRVTLSELGVAAVSDREIARLQARAENIREISGDHRLESFIMRIARFDASDAAIEALASLSLNKPPREWSDADVERAGIELARLCRAFLDMETFAHVKGREDGRHSLAIAVGLNGAAAHERFEVAQGRQLEVDALVKSLAETLQSRNEPDRTVVLAALAKLADRYIKPETDAEA